MSLEAKVHFIVLSGMGVKDMPGGVTMWNSFFQAICRTGIFMICAQAVVHFRPQESYEKYLKLLISVMVLVQLFLPVGSFLLGGGGQEAAELLRQFGLDLEESMRMATENAAETDAILEQMTLEEIMRQMEEGQIEEQTGDGSYEEEGAEGVEDGISIKEIELEIDPITIDLTEEP